jgi:HK97 family phage major capsid protein
MFENLLMSGQATTNTVRYAVERTATSGAAGVAEGGTKPESTLVFSTLDEPVKKIATSITISDELIEDAPAMQTFINGQLSLFVNIETERQLFRGISGGNESILTSRGVPVYRGRHGRREQGRRAAVQGDERDPGAARSWSPSGS